MLGHSDSSLSLADKDCLGAFYIYAAIRDEQMEEEEIEAD